MINTNNTYPVNNYSTNDSSSVIIDNKYENKASDTNIDKCKKFLSEASYTFSKMSGKANDSLDELTSIIQKNLPDTSLIHLQKILQDSDTQTSDCNSHPESLCPLDLDKMKKNISSLDLAQRMSTVDNLTRFQKNAIRNKNIFDMQMRHYQKKIHKLLEDINIGVTMARSLCSKDSQQSIDSIDKLIQEEELAKGIRANQKKLPKNQLKKSNPPKKQTATLVNSVSKSLLKVQKKTEQTFDLSDIVLKLYKKSSYKELERIKRWEKDDPSIIRQFIDRNEQAQEIFRYQNLSDEEILEQRAKHYLPFTERLLTDKKISSIYTFPTDRGYGVICQLHYQKQPINGVLYFGVDQKIIFHKYFEKMNFKESKASIFSDKQSSTQREEKENVSEWITKDKAKIDISETGVLEFTYSENHSIQVFPIRKELLPN